MLGSVLLIKCFCSHKQNSNLCTPDLVRQYQLLYYLMDSTLEMSVPACSVRARCCSPRAPPP